MSTAKNYFSTDFRLGIVGGGQLGKMILQETRRLDIGTRILDPSPSAPCRIGCNEFTVGSLQDFDTVYQFGKDCDVITIEIENVKYRGLKAIAKRRQKSIPSTGDY